MTSRTRTTFAFATVLASTLALAGCSLLGLDGPPRGDDGQVTETTVIKSTQLLEGDCFTFVEGSNANDAEVTPCSEDHQYIVIGQGSLSQSEVDNAGGLQNAVSAACADTFEAFKAEAAEGVRPEQEFIVSQVTEDDVVTTNYSCVATDASGAS
ncbi:hypothetical protein BH10ACT7_BH10ACT7_13990 [soil metagenome]